VDRPWNVRDRSGLAIVCVALAIGLGLKYPGFLTTSNFFVTLLSVTSILIAGLGTTALLVSANVDLSIGGQYAFIGVIVGEVAAHSHNTILAILSGLACGVVIGYINGRLVRMLRISPLIVTLGMATLLEGLAGVVSGGTSVFGFPQGLTTLGQSHLFGQVPLPVIVGLIVFVIGGVLLLRTVAGLRVYAIGGNPVATRLAGVDTDRYVTWLYGLNGCLMGLVAVMSVAQLGSASPTVGVGFELQVLTAVILGGVAFTGGKGHPLGVFLGVFTIGILNAGVVFAGISDFWQQVVQGAALLFALGADQLASYRRARRASRAHANDEAVETSSAAPHEQLADEMPAYELPAPSAVIEAATALSCSHLSKRYGSVAATNDVSFSVAPGEILGLVGDNGAGKSTIIKMLSGALVPDAGSIEIAGAEHRLDSPATARGLGVTTVYQELALCPNLGVAENLTLGREPRRTRGGILAWRNHRAAEELARARLSALKITLDDFWRSVSLLSGGQRQAVAIARAVEPGARVVILDEPTAALGRRQTDSVLALIRTLAQRGVAVIIVMHDLETVLDLADRIVVLRLGRVSFDGPAHELTESSLIHAMAGLPFTTVSGGQPASGVTTRSR
jgi:ribose/xylose/arabinose/galactoside ABC-type transport system permease subunit/ABC-type multidrug transport system ATPase subunit